jgi:hypothetical protein
MSKWTVPIAGVLMSLSGGGQAAVQAAPASPRPSVDDQQALDTCLSPADQQRSPADFSPAQRLQIVGCLTAASARQLNAQLPRQVDALTRLDQVTAAGAELTYHYSISRAAADLPADVGARLETAKHGEHDADGRRLRLSLGRQRRPADSPDADHRLLSREGRERAPRSPALSFRRDAPRKLR